MNVTHEERTRRYEEFKRNAWKIYQPVIDAWEKTFDDPNGETEIQVLHRIDLLIWKKCPKIDRGQIRREQQREAARYGE
jgi:hypothetical protein